MLIPTLAAERFRSLWKFLNRQMSLTWEERWSEPFAPWPVATYFHALPLGGRYKSVTCLTSSIASAAPFVHSFSDSSAIGCSCSSCRWIEALYSLHEPCSDPNLYTAFLQIISTYFLIPPSPQKKSRGCERQLSLILTHLKTPKFSKEDVNIFSHPLLRKRRGMINLYTKGKWAIIYTSCFLPPAAKEQKREERRKGERKRN